MGRLTLETGRVAGWFMLAFVGAIGVHSIVPFWHTSALLLGISFLCCCVCAGIVRSRLVMTIALVVASLLFGWWRFESAPRPVLRRIDGRQFIARTERETSVFVWMRHELSSRIHLSLPHNEAELLTGILYGDQELPKELRDRFRSAGLMHIVAVSGSNVTVVVQCVMAMVLRLRVRRRRAFYLTSIALGCFVLFVGAAASVARAAFMGWLMLVAREVGRKASSSRLLLVAATVLLLMNPWQMGFDIGFALSFLAMWGLLELAPVFERWCWFIPKQMEIRQTVSMTLAATLMTAPYAAWAFGRVSLAGLFTNIVALPLIPFIMAFGALVAVWGSLPFFSTVNIPVLGLLRVLIWIAGWADRFPSLDLRMEHVSGTAVIAVYLVIVYFVRRYSGKTDLSTEKRGQRKK